MLLLKTAIIQELSHGLDRGGIACWIGFYQSRQDYDFLYNCYNIGSVNGENVVYAGSILGNGEYFTMDYVYGLTGTYTNLFGKNTANYAYGTNSNGFKTASEMKSTAFLNLLNTNNTGKIWKIEASKNNGYPIFSWQ